ncbi:MAG: cell division protein SepF [Nitriliruptor sp.]|uniref:cell division protein SepF n=1 Tax=Nitriliruptor sp. TaxID=2448056 RepID=UPI0034A0AAE7
MSSGLWYRTLVYLGLKEEPEEGYDDLPERVTDTSRRGDAGYWEQRPAPEPAAGGHERFDPVGDPDLDPDRPRSVGGDSNVRPLRVADAGHARSRGGVRLAVVEVGRFDDVEQVGSRYRTGQPVLFDVSGADGATARRVVDFVSGLTYALRGRMTKVGTRAFLLVPDGVSLPDDEVRRLTTLGYRLPTGSDS